MPYHKLHRVYRDFASPRRIALSYYRAFKKIALNLRTGTALLFLHCTHSHLRATDKNRDSLCAFVAALPYRRTKITLNLHTVQLGISNAADKNYAFIIASTAPTN